MTEIKEHAFYNCTQLKYASLSKNLTVLGDHAFKSTALTNIIIPDSLTSLGNSVFANCSSLKNISFGNGLKSIGNYAFGSCKALTDITISDSVTLIGEEAFSLCTSLTNVVISENIASIGRNSFNNCVSLKSVYLRSPKKPASMGLNIYAFTYCPEDMVIYYPSEAEEYWDDPWQGFHTAPWNPAPAAPTITVSFVTRNPETGEISFTLTFTGTLQESSDGITWSDVADVAETSYSVTVQKNQNRFFRAIVH